MPVTTKTALVAELCISPYSCSMCSSAARQASAGPTPQHHEVDCLEQAEPDQVPVGADANPLGSNEVLAGLIQLALHVLRICTAAQQSLVAKLSAAMTVSPSPGAAKAAVRNDTSCIVIDLTADDEVDGLESAAQQTRVCKQPQDTWPQVTDTAQTMETAYQAASSNSVDSPQGESEAGTSGRVADDAAEPCLRGPWPVETMADECMLAAYGMDLVAVISCLMQQVEHWPGTVLMHLS